MCLCKNENCDWRTKSKITAVIEIVCGFVGAILMILTLCAYHPEGGSLQDLQGFALSIDPSKTLIIVFLVMNLLVILSGILLVVATWESIVTSKPKVCYLMVCAWLIWTAANCIFNFIAVFLVVGKQALWLPIISFFVHVILIFPLPPYATTLYKKVYRPEQTRTITPFGEVREYKEPEVPKSVLSYITEPGTPMGQYALAPGV